MEEGEKVNFIVQGKKRKESGKNKGNIPPQPIIKKDSRCSCKQKLRRKPA